MRDTKIIQDVKQPGNSAENQTERTWFGETQAAHLQGMLAIAKTLYLDESTLTAIAHLDSTLSTPKLQAQFGEETSSLIKSFQALEATRNKAATGQVETLRKMLLAFSQDIRVVLMYLSSRLQTLRWVTQQKMDVPTEWSAELLEIDAALANRLGVWQIKWEMEDLAFRCMEPKAYYDIAKQLDGKRNARQAFISNIMTQFETLLQEQRIPAQIQGRPKHIYSIWKKMKGKSLDFTELRDISAIRILVDTVPQCYAVLGIAHDVFKPVLQEFDDYIANPKPNGYQSLHTVVTDDHGTIFEIQIRTQEMHHQAEYGVAAHWRYKEGVQNGTLSDAALYEQRIAWARQLISWKDEAWEQMKGQSIDDHIYALTPLGRVIPLDPNSTPLDFAYAVHTNIGHRCRGAKIDGQMVTLDTIVKSGQTVEILTVKQGGPSRDWLLADKAYVASHRAKSKIRAWFHAQETELEHKDHKPEKELKEKLEEETSPSPEIMLRPSKRKSEGGDVLVVGVDSLMTQLSKCCRPVPPDEICGFVTRGRGVSIHRQQCATLKQLLQRAPERIIKTAWGASSQAEKALFSVEIFVLAIDRQGLLRDISEVYSKLKINVIGVNTLSSKGMATMSFSVEVHQATDIQLALNALSEVKGVTEVARK
ncbi:GTP pyrophosphokinase [Polynucleobacter sp. SHI8]|uniref:RelA/SpoT family protein n=1 Tax=unclassified Polynucleobacter TaxID=2640945 RepID=UPI0024924074|nr:MULTISPECIES: HD domain-containing protein [unclassified Polynucleobacter]BDW11495.1 GTP pyrophosphokinase [Polynucleobacter sp. SHI2]BDW13942.1 GTP pyrophosphokinase [Polynucleobacter sp. SHI8]